MAGQQQTYITILLTEYEKLKDEQIARIGFRDNLIYATLVAIGGVISFVLSNPANYQALLALPLATFVLGWVYLDNDRKIALIRQYIRTSLAPQLREATGNQSQHILGWERSHQRDAFRLWRGIMQMLVNQALFVGPGLVAALLLMITTSAASPAVLWIGGVEILALLALGVEITIYANLRAKA